MDPLTTAALTAFATTVATNSSKAPLQSLDNFWYMTFGHKVEYYAELKRAKNEVNIAQYKESISNHVSEILEENLQEPSMSIVGPALEASKYYIEEEELREMFSKIIAASMDSTKADDIHHSFVEIIKQLSPRDAQNIAFVKNQLVFPIVNYVLITKNVSGSRMVKNIVFSKNNLIEEKDSASISNLARLGLLSISFEQEITDDFAYLPYSNNPYYNSLKSQFDNESDTLEIKKGTATITPLGRLFVKVCL